MVIKIIIGIVVYILILFFICIFFKGATKIGNEFEQRKEAERILKKYETSK